MQRILTNWWFVSISTAVLAILFLCAGLPTFVGALRPVWLRLLIGLGIALLWAVLWFLRRRKGERASAAIAAELSASSDGDAETAALSNSMAEALKTLQTANGGNRRDYLYSRPWYVIIGPPGAGKTTALVNSGLRFPYSIYTLLGVGGTRNLEFMFADEAVMVDTAGRYTSQDSDAAVDARGWDGFLSLLRRHRPLQPINGIIVAIGVDELVAGDRQSIDLHATTVRRRLAEVRRTLEIDVPVYVLIPRLICCRALSNIMTILMWRGDVRCWGIPCRSAANAPKAPLSLMRSTPWHAPLNSAAPPAWPMNPTRPAAH